jgi:hypothetical protein
MFGWFKRKPRERILVREEELEDPEHEADEDEEDDGSAEEIVLPRWYHVMRLAARVARRRRFRELNAPACFIEKDTELIARAVSELAPAEALSVLMQWQSIAPLEHVGRDEEPGDTSEGGDKS